VGVVMADGKRYVEISRDGTYTRLQAWTKDAIWLRSSWGMDGKSTLAISDDGRQFHTLLADYPLAWGSYRGSRIGLFTFNPSGEKGHVDVDEVIYDVGNGTGSAPRQ
jgi:hypothetical protein